LGSAPLAFRFGDINIDEEPAIQFKDGVFNGFNFSDTFLLNGNAFRFDIDGSGWDIKIANKNGIYSKLAASGTLNMGSSGLLDQQVLEPPSTPPAELPIDIELPTNVPESATLPTKHWYAARRAGLGVRFSRQAQKFLSPNPPCFTARC